MTAPPIAPLVVGRAERHVIHQLQRAGAVQENQAVSLPELRFVEAKRLERLLDAGILAEPFPGKYWLREGAYQQYRRQRRNRGLIAALLIAAALGVLLWFVRTNRIAPLQRSVVPSLILAANASAGALSLPLHQIAKRADTHFPKRDQDIVVYCAAFT